MFPVFKFNTYNAISRHVFLFVFKTHTTPGVVAIFQIVIVDMEMECAQTTQLQKHDYTKNSIRSNKRQKKKKTNYILLSSTAVLQQTK